MCVVLICVSDLCSWNFVVCRLGCWLSRFVGRLVVMLGGVVFGSVVGLVVSCCGGWLNRIVSVWWFLVCCWISCVCVVCCVVRFCLVCVRLSFDMVLVVCCDWMSVSVCIVYVMFVLLSVICWFR